MNYITATQAAAILKVHPGHATRLLDRERVKFEQVGKARAYKTSDVNRLAAKRMIEKFRR